MVKAVQNKTFAYERAFSEIKRLSSAGLEGPELLRRSADTDDVVALKPMRLFHWSNMYLSLLFVAVALDPLLTR